MTQGDDQLPVSPSFSRVALRISAIYVVAGFLWVMISDRLLSLLVSRADILTKLQSVKGVGFILATAFILYLLLRYYLAHLDRAMAARGKIQEQLAVERCLLRTVIDSIPDLIFFKDVESVYTGCNHAFEEYAGKSEAQLIGHSDLELFPSAAAEFYREKDRQMLSVGEPQRNEEWIDYPDGRRVLLETLKTPHYDSQGRSLGLIGISRDITDRHRLEISLQTNNDKLRAIIEESPMAIITLNPLGLITSWNPAAERIFGWSAAEVIDLPLPTVPPDQRGECDKSQASVLSGKCSSNRYARRLRKDGAMIDVSISAAPLYGPDGKVRGIVALMSDITDTLRSEVELREIQLRQRAILDTIPDMAWLKDRESRYIMVNEAFARACGIEAEALLGLSDLDCWPEELAGKYRRDDLLVMAQNSRQRLEESLVDVSGKQIWIDTIKSPLRGSDGEVVGTVGIARDITQRKRIEDALRQSEELFRQVFDNSTFGMALVAQDGRILQTNGSFQEMLGYSGDELCSMSYEDITHPEDLPKDQQAFQRLLVDGSDYYRLEKRYLKKSGGIVWARLTVNVIRGSHGEPRTIIGMVEDITQQVAADAEVKQYQEQLENLTSELFLAEERERRRIASMLHDDVGQTLALARIQLSTAPEKSWDRWRNDMSDTLQVAIDRIRSLTFQLSPPLLYDVGLAAAVEALAERFSTDHGLRITVTAEGSASSYLEEISVPLFQMIRELLTNVVKHAQAASVEIRLTDDGKRLTVVVADDGQGFTVEGFGNAGGYGLFSICQRLQHLGGNCDIESSKGGTSVRLWLPLPETGSLQ